METACLQWVMPRPVVILGSTGALTLNSRLLEHKYVRAPTEPTGEARSDLVEQWQSHLREHIIPYLNLAHRSALRAI